VVSGIRALVRRAPLNKNRLDLNHAIREVIALARGELRRNQVALRTELEDALLPVLGDRVQLQQVVLNLIMNGIEASKPVADRPRDLVVATRNVDPSLVHVIVQDSGIGIDAQSRDRVFDAFYSTKPGGMGMGLSISRSIVSDHGGRLWIRENEGPGSIFQFTIPTFK
jgi:signal transduction histidine kinase